nr:hypothetical protein [Navicula tsukamotoi]
MLKKYSQVIDVQNKKCNKFGFKDASKVLEDKISFQKVNYKPILKDHSNFIPKNSIDENLFQLFLKNAGRFSKQKKDLRELQLRIAYMILYNCQLRINQIRYLTQENLETAVSKGHLTLIDPNTKQKQIYILSTKIINQFKILAPKWRIIFEKYQYKYLFGKEKPMTDKNLIKIVNQNLENTCINYNIAVKITSDYFRYSESKHLPTIIYIFENDILEKIAELIHS